ncbi:DNA cytosine methyltransferase [uncultured Alistipes sp.]|uniref:DNA cytosine methyltransferase n=1 Tax=uncultured Alistipes sp. TaxID=538949 RepID=UPI001434E3EC|nr:DNA (cytosine-5-)-methyltransferase [uncultured Alistipes sp.]GFI53792.1 modification methylase HpaII [Alistipes sp.]
MATVDKDIKADSAQIKAVKKVIKHKSETIEHKQLTQEKLAVDSWRDNMFSHPKKTVRIGTAFSGIGAIEHAFQRLGLKHEIVFAGDIDDKCRKSYFANYPISEKDWFSDIREFDASPYRGKVDFIVGGAPCQAFSMVGKRLGFEDARGTLFYEFARIIKETQPKLFLFENVKGLLNHDKGKTWNVIHDIFEELGYDVHYRVLNSKDYGIPQHRERLYCIGFKKKTSFRFPAPISLEYKMYDFLEDYVDSKYFLKEKGVKFVTSHKNRDKCYTQINGDVALCQKRNQQFNWHGDFVFHPAFEEDFDEFVFDVKDVEEKYYLSDKVAKYVLAGGTKNFRTSTQTDLDVARPLLHSMHKMHRAGVDNYVSHKGRLRKLTPRECLRLMGFKDSFKIAVSDTATYQQAGNSIVVDVLIALLKQLDITKYGI